ncbi:MAG: chemotaxis protein CheA, partial [Hyphomicrobiales bacterium]|nr:chemotaxis protein CheA [Hyphomicrobiales bacterium]
LDQFRHVYFQECEDLLGSLEVQLMALQEGAAADDVIQETFRAIHSIKGGAGALQFKRIGAFAHNFEALFDKIRSGETALNPDLVTLSLHAFDMLADLIAAEQSGAEIELGIEDHISEALQEAIGTEQKSAREDRAEAGREVSGASEPDAPTLYRITFRPPTDSITRGNEPLYLIRALKTLGRLSVSADQDSLPLLEDIDPQASYLAWNFELETGAGPEAIAEMFEFVADDSDLSITALNESENADDGRTASADPASNERKSVEEGETSEAGGGSQGAAKSAANPNPDMNESNSRYFGATSVRVDLDRVDRLVNMVGELVIAYSTVLQHVDDRLRMTHPQLVHELSQFIQHTQTLQDSVMAIRAQPVRSIFARMPRLVRDLSDQTGKRVRLKTKGESTEIDKTVIEKLSDPLVHMIRNAIDHGIETVEERQALGKPPEGTITLSAEQIGGRIIIRVRDDGRGIDRERMRRVAVDKNLIAPDANLSDEEIENLVFLPGFSTARSVSDISGRGVGMDVVHQNIQKLGGRVSMRSQPGRGSTITLALPLTLAVMDGMIVRCGDFVYVIPLANIIQSLSPRPEEIGTLPDTGDVLRFRDQYVKLVDLNDAFGTQSAAANDNQLIIIVEAEAGGVVGIVVEEILGQEQVVIKSLEENFSHVRGIAGATIMGDGRVALILDVTAIGKLGGKRPNAGTVAEPGVAELQEISA